MDVNLMPIDQNVRITQLFVKALGQCRTVTQINNVYCLAKVLIGIILTVLSLIRTCDWDSLNLWLLLVIVQSAIGFGCCWKLMECLKQLPQVVRVAEDLHQAIYVNDDFQPLTEAEYIVAPDLDPTLEVAVQEEGRRIQILATQIKTEITNRNIGLKWIGHIGFLFNQALIIWGFVIEFSHPKQNLQDQIEQCKGSILIFLFVFLLLSIYQYLDFYILVVLVLICLPFLLAFLIYTKIKEKKERHLTQVLLEDMLKKCERQYQPNQVEGDQECHICMSAYALNETLILMPCNKLHHFHKTCVSAWLNLSQSCPLCRQPFLKEDSNVEV